MYRPQPLDTHEVALDPELRALVERIAEHNHDVWAQGRLADGWVYGPERDDARKTHPCLVAYEDLPELEKDYDRRTTIEVLRVAQALGFEIVRAGTFAAGGAAAADATTDVEECCARARALIRRGDPLLGYDLVQEALESHPGDVRLRELQGLALARSGAVERANALARDLRAEGHRSPESGGLLARTHKDLAEQAGDDATRRKHLDDAFELYEVSFREALRAGDDDGALFNGINAATLSFLRGEREESRKIAREVLGCIERADAKAGGDDYWRVATLGEARLLLGDPDGARSAYARAAELAGERWADLSSTRRQAKRVLAAQGEDAGWLAEVMRVPPVAVFSGHMIDAAGRAEPRFPPSREAAVRAQLETRLRELAPVAGYASAACGADLIFHEVLQEIGSESHVVLPYPPEIFASVSVERGGAEWMRRFERVLERAASVFWASEDRASGSASGFAYANLIHTGTALLRARTLETQCAALAVWDGRPGDGPGGTASVVAEWSELGLAVERIDPLGTAAPAGASSSRAKPPQRGAAPAEVDHPLVAMLFADAVGYSKLTEDQIPIFVKHFLGSIAELIGRSAFKPVLKETMGDGFYFVFEDVRAAGRFGLELSELDRETDWTGFGLPERLALRTGLHCGPVHRCWDPVSQMQKYTGPHTSRTARIEPITPPGQVYASQAFAAVAAAAGVEELGFEYVGRTALAKKYGSLPLYHVRRA